MTNFPRAHLLIAGLGVALLAPLLWGGFFADDYFHLSRASQAGDFFPLLLSIYRVADAGQRTGITWWANPQLQLLAVVRAGDPQRFLSSVEALPSQKRKQAAQQ